MRYQSQGLLIFFQVAWYLTAQLMLMKKDILSFAFPIISLSLWFYLFKPHLKQVITVFTLGIIGLAWDLLLFRFNILVFADGFPLGMISVWLFFCSVLNIYTEMFFTRKYLGAILTGIFAPLSYLAAEKLQVLTIPNKTAILYLIIFWFIYFLLSHHLLSTKTGRNYET